MVADCSGGGTAKSAGKACTALACAKYKPRIIEVNHPPDSLRLGSLFVPPHQWSHESAISVDQQRSLYCSSCACLGSDQTQAEP